MKESCRKKSLLLALEKIASAEINRANDGNGSICVCFFYQPKRPKKKQ